MPIATVMQTTHSVECVYTVPATTLAVTVLFWCVPALVLIALALPDTRGVICGARWVLFFLKRTVAREGIFVSRDVAVQLHGTSLLGTSVYHTCVDMRILSGVFLNEGFLRHAVTYYLCVVHEVPTTKERRVDVVFRDAMPRLAELKEVYRKVLTVLG